MKKYFHLFAILACANVFASCGNDNNWIQIKPEKPKDNIIYFMKTDDGCEILGKYNDAKDAIIKFGISPINSNKSPTFTGVYTAANTDSNPDKESFSKSQTCIFNGSSTDIVSPYIIEAIDNPDTNIDINFTSGFHGTDGGLSGNRTATNEYIKVIANGREIKSGDNVIKTDSVKIIVSNLVQARNTAKEDGSGRNVMKETITYDISEINDVKCTIEIQALEDIKLYSWYGLQNFLDPSTYATEQGMIRFEGDNLWDSWQPIRGKAGYFYRAGNKLSSHLTRIIATDGNGNYTDLYLDNKDAGTHTWLSNEENIASMNRITDEYAKTYMMLVTNLNPVLMRKGQSLKCSGGWRIYYKQ